MRDNLGELKEEDDVGGSAGEGVLIETLGPKLFKK